MSKALVFVFALMSLLVGQVGRPEDTVQAFAKALAKDDFPSMARLVAGGNPSYPFHKLRTDDQELSTVYNKFTVKVKSVKVTGDRALVIVDYSYRTSEGQEGGGNGEKVPLELSEGSWKIVPYTRSSPTGYFFERFANVLAHPDEIYADLEKAYGPTRNVGLVEAKLGKARTDFMKAIWDAVEKRPYGNVPYIGYKSMAMVEHTTIYWPVGKSDELIFDMGLEEARYLTGWKRVNGKPKRLWQVKLATGAQSGTGTLAKVLGKTSYRVPKTGNAALSAALSRVTGYAGYQEAGAVGVFYCWVVRPDGTTVPSPVVGEKSVTQDSHQAFSRGFFVMPEETRLLAGK